MISTYGTSFYKRGSNYGRGQARQGKQREAVDSTPTGWMVGQHLLQLGHPRVLEFPRGGAVQDIQVPLTVDWCVQGLLEALLPCFINTTLAAKETTRILLPKQHHII